MSGKSSEVIGLFHDSTELERCVFELSKLGIFKDQIKTAKVGSSLGKAIGFKNELAIAGAGVGSIIGILFGFLYSSGHLDFVPGFPNKIISKSISILVGWLLGAILGGMAGFFIKLKIPSIKEESLYLKIPAEDIQLSIEVKNREEKSIVRYKMAQYGATHIRLSNAGPYSNKGPTVK